jgi:hypothetical protein
MATGEGPRKRLPTPDLLEPVGMPMELRCGACDKKGKYPVGRLFVDPIVAKSKEPEAMDRSFGFTGYFHCKHCGAGGPWHLTTTSTVMLVALTMEAVQGPSQSRLFFGQMTMFDGTVSRWPTQAEAHLEELIDKEPGNHFLWSRLGNIYKMGEVHDLALEAFREAVRLNEHDVESLHSIAEIHLERDVPEEAARYFHLVLRHARHAPANTPPSLLRDMLHDAIESLAKLQVESGKRIAIFPAMQVPAGLNPNREDDRERLVEWWITGRLPAPAPRNERRSAWADAAHPAPAHVGRNDRCPCGSGKKYKNCCLRR